MYLDLPDAYLYRICTRYGYAAKIAVPTHLRFCFLVNFDIAMMINYFSFQKFSWNCKLAFDDLYP